MPPRMTDATPASTRPHIDPARPVIVIFGAAVRPDGSPSRTLRRRVEAAFAFAGTLDRPVFVPTGGVGRFGPAESAVMAGLLREWGVADAAIVEEPTATDTLSSVRAVRHLLGGHAGWGHAAGGHVGKVHAATSAYHLPRCVALLFLAGLPAGACPPPPWPAAAAWRKRWYWRLREAAALPYDVAILLALRAVGRL